MPVRRSFTVGLTLGLVTGVFFGVATLELGKRWVSYDGSDETRNVRNESWNRQIESVVGRLGAVEAALEAIRIELRWGPPLDRAVADRSADVTDAPNSNRGTRSESESSALLLDKGVAQAVDEVGVSQCDPKVVEAIREAVKQIGIRSSACEREIAQLRREAGLEGAATTSSDNPNHVRFLSGAMKAYDEYVEARASILDELKKALRGLSAH